jgi:signal transduction histidine kinase/DNA-binding CsgD family transcriptional regulator
MGQPAKSFDEPLAVSADLSCSDVGESAALLHRWLRQHCEHDGIAVTTSSCGAPLSVWTSPTFEFPAGLDWSSPTTVNELGRRLVVASGDAASSTATILVALTEHSAGFCSRLESTLQALARVVAARFGRAPSEAESAQLSLAHAVAGERDRVTQELTDNFAQHLHTILNHLRDGADGDAHARVHFATSVASRALLDLREPRRPVWRQTRRVDEAFGEVESDLDDLARAAGLELELVLVGTQSQTVANSVLDAACWITRAAMLNVVEHSGAARARVEWRVESDELALSIVDDGRGFDPECSALGGLRAMRRRAATLGGSLEIESTSGWGTRLQACLRSNDDQARPADESASALIRTLRDRELDVLELMASGRSNRDIASELFVSHHTVKFHLANIFEKLGVQTRAEAAAVAFAAGTDPRLRAGSER